MKHHCFSAAKHKIIQYDKQEQATYIRIRFFQEGTFICCP
jgi:hypothetical protein